jgi:hypothetical protein
MVGLGAEQAIKVPATRASIKGGKAMNRLFLGLFFPMGPLPARIGSFFKMRTHFEKASLYSFLWKNPVLSNEV